VLARVLALAEKVSYVFVASADGDGIPHMASAGSFTLAPEERVVLTEWFCPITVANLQQNPHVAIVVWDQIGDEGYQLLGEVERMRDLAILDGFVPGKVDPIAPQVERELLVRVRQIIGFSHAPHRDEPL
jgi:hypothetical protein